LMFAAATALTKKLKLNTQLTAVMEIVVFFLGLTVTSAAVRANKKPQETRKNPSSYHLFNLVYKTGYFQLIHCRTLSVGGHQPKTGQRASRRVTPGSMLVITVGE